MLSLAITGLGVVSPLGIGRVAFHESLGDARALEKALSRPRSVLAGERFARAKVAELGEFDGTQYLGDKGLRNFDRLTRMLIVAAKHALEDAGIKEDGAFVVSARERVGICAATAYGSLDSITEINRVAELEHPRYLNPSRFPNTVINSAAGYVSIWEGLEGPNVTIVDGNCGSLDAVLTAEMHLACGRADALLVGGGEVLSEPLYLAFEKLGLIDQGDAKGSGGAGQGMRLGEGAALLVLESTRAARARGASVYGELIGFGHAFEPPPSEARLVHMSEGAVERAVRAALRDARVTAADIDLVISGESGVSAFDAAEVRGLEAVFSADVATVAGKAVWGETFGAAGAFSMAAALAWLSGATPAPLARGALAHNVKTVLVSAVGYYGNVSAVVMKKA